MRQWDYYEEDYINEFVKYVGGNCRLSVSLAPNIPEFIDALYNGIYPEIPELKDKLAKNNEKLNNKQIKVFSLMSICKKHDIFPFWGLFIKPYLNPELKYLSPDAKEWEVDEVRNICIQPFQFAGNKKWYNIHLNEFINQDVNSAKIAIEGFVKDGYKLMNVFTQLNPRSYTSDHYNDYEKTDLDISVGGGKITVYDKVPENFYIPTTKDALKDFFNSNFKPKGELL